MRSKDDQNAKRRDETPPPIEQPHADEDPPTWGSAGGGEIYGLQKGKKRKPDEDPRPQAPAERQRRQAKE